jgi:hypothetical protein
VDQPGALPVVAAERRRFDSTTSRRPADGRETTEFEWVFLRHWAWFDCTVVLLVGTR